jgi:NAD(P)-dependent dehydrogenase (short-subunit alcohol dehydrogenase family)
MNYGFDGKVALVTGASGGIGRATALGFAASGAAVVVSDVNDAGGEETVALIAAAGGTAVYQRCNVADAGEVRALVARAVANMAAWISRTTMPASTIWVRTSIRTRCGIARWR